MRQPKPIDPDTTCRVACQLSWLEAPPGAPGGNPSEGSAPEEACADQCDAIPDEESGSPQARVGGAPQGAPYAKRADNRHGAGHDQIDNLDPSQVAKCEQAPLISGQAEPASCQCLRQGHHDVEGSGEGEVAQQTSRDVCTGRTILWRRVTESALGFRNGGHGSPFLLPAPSRSGGPGTTLYGIVTQCCYTV